MDQPSTSSSTTDTENALCGICNKNALEKLVLVSPRGKETLKNASIERQDNLFSNLKTSHSLMVHASCRSDYVHKHNVEAAKRKAELQKSSNVSPVKRKLRKTSLSSSVASDMKKFDWKKNVLFATRKQI